MKMRTPMLFLIAGLALADVAGAAYLWLLWQDRERAGAVHASADPEPVATGSTQARAAPALH
jgi:hypothetical protein